jgi:hypothetical protein
MQNSFSRAQEWLADRFSFVQYPRIRQVRSKPRQIDRGPSQLRLWEGLWLIWFGFVVMVLSGALLIFMGLFFWHFITGS